ncbi:hypothetical protein CRUP_000181 [Coryphaenoides rupestris]|nr:hypothetical protein CRUP_000181 [Coryphaenoides rupestris]
MKQSAARIITCVYVVGFMDLFGVSMIIPLLSHHVKHLGATPTVAGVVGSTYGILQLFSSTIVGLDRDGFLGVDRGGFLGLDRDDSPGSRTTGTSGGGHEDAVLLRPDRPAEEDDDEDKEEVDDSSVGSFRRFLVAVGPGGWSDVVGRRYSLLTCLLLSSLGYGLLGLSTSITMFVIARIPVGLFKHSLSICRALLSDLVSEAERPLVMGHFNAASSVGFILGPVALVKRTDANSNSHICEICPDCSAAAAKCPAYQNGSSAGGVPQRAVPGAELPDPGSPGPPGQPPSSGAGVRRGSLLRSAWMQLASVGSRIRLVDSSDMWDLFLVRLLMAVGIMLYYSNFTLAMEERFSIKPKVTGYLISYSSTLGALAGCLVGPVTRLYRQDMPSLLLHSTLLTCGLIFLYAAAPTVWHVVLSSTFFAVSTTVGRTCITDLELQRGGLQASGTLIGAGQSVTAVGRILAPLLSGLAQEVSPCGPPSLGVLLALAAALAFDRVSLSQCKWMGLASSFGCLQLDVMNSSSYERKRRGTRETFQ